MVPQTAPEFQEPGARHGAPQNGQRPQNGTQGLQIEEVHDKNLDQSQNIDGQERVSHDAHDGPKTDGVRGADQVDDQRHGQAAKEAVDVNVSELELSRHDHFAPQQEQEGDRSREVAVLANGGRVDPIAAQARKGKDDGFGFEDHVLEVDAQFFQEWCLVFDRRIVRIIGSCAAAAAALLLHGRRRHKHGKGRHPTRCSDAAIGHTGIHTIGIRRRHCWSRRVHGTG